LREERGLHGPGQRDARRHHGDEDVDDPDRRLEDERHRGAPDGHGLDRVSEGERAISPEPVTKHRRQRCRQRGRKELDRCHQARLRGAAPLVREDEDRYPEAPFGQPEQEEGEQHPSQVPVGEHGPERSHLPGEPIRDPHPGEHRRFDRKEEDGAEASTERRQVSRATISTANASFVKSLRASICC
jgi:hypothetical protein